MNLGIYLDSQKQTDQTNQIYNTLNNFVETNQVDNASLFYNDIDYNPITPKFGMFNSTDLWYFTGTLLVTTVKNALSLRKIINKFKPYFLYSQEKNTVLEIIEIGKKMPIIAYSDDDAKYIKRISGYDAKVLRDGKIENLVEVLDV